MDHLALGLSHYRGAPASRGAFEQHQSKEARAKVAKHKKA